MYVALLAVQNPESRVGSVRESLALIYGRGGVSALWHGTSAGIMKTVPKYCVAVAVKVRHCASVLPFRYSVPMLTGAYYLLPIKTSATLYVCGVVRIGASRLFVGA